MAAARSPRLGARRAATAAAGGAAVALLVSGWSSLRNLLHYGDPLGISFALRTMASHVPRGEPRPLRLDSLAWLVERGFLRQTFNSFVGHFGYPDVTLPKRAYLTLGVVWAILSALSVVEPARSGDRALRRPRRRSRRRGRAGRKAAGGGPPLRSDLLIFPERR